jgi:hypothetical protein
MNNNNNKEGILMESDDILLIENIKYLLLKIGY